MSRHRTRRSDPSLHRLVEIHHMRELEAPKSVGPRAGTILPFPQFSADLRRMQGAAHSDSSLENSGPMARSRAVGKGTDGLGTLVFICRKEIVQAFMAQRLKEPFSEDKSSSKMRGDFALDVCIILTCRDRAVRSMH